MNPSGRNASVEVAGVVVVVGQTPPPFHGQSIMIARMLAAEYSDIRLIHVRMGFSRDFAEMKKFQWRKVMELLRVIWGVLAARFGQGATVLYYPPAGPDLMPVLRDIAVLASTRWLFRKTIFHFHAGGLTSIYPRLNGPLRLMYRLAFRKPDIAIRLSLASPDDGSALAASRECIVPNGVDDLWVPEQAAARGGDTILFVGMLSEAKGILVLVDALAKVRAKGAGCRVELMGRFPSPEVESRVRAHVAAAGLASEVVFLGELHAEEKRAAFSRASIFCFPSFYESESFPVAVIEAMSFRLPVVATRWRGIPELVVDGETGFLVEPHDADAVAERLLELQRDQGLRERLGAAGRARYLDRYTTQRYLAGLHAVFRTALGRQN
jgi:glycosyltransferase involved in cell wall biosynthesis